MHLLWVNLINVYCVGIKHVLFHAQVVQTAAAEKLFLQESER